MNQVQLVSVRYGKAQYFAFDIQFVGFELFYMAEYLPQLGCLLRGYRAILGSLDFLKRLLVAGMHKRGDVKLLPRMVQDVLGN